MSRDIKLMKLKIWKNLKIRLNMNALLSVTIWEVWEEVIIPLMEKDMIISGIVSMTQAFIKQILKVLLMLLIMSYFIRELKISQIKL
jgi:hypothetical protein